MIGRHFQGILQACLAAGVLPLNLGLKGLGDKFRGRLARRRGILCRNRPGQQQHRREQTRDAP